MYKETYCTMWSGPWPITSRWEGVRDPLWSLRDGPWEFSFSNTPSIWAPSPHTTPGCDEYEILIQTNIWIYLYLKNDTNEYIRINKIIRIWCKRIFEYPNICHTLTHTNMQCSVLWPMRISWNIPLLHPNVLNLLIYSGFGDFYTAKRNGAGYGQGRRIYWKS